MKKIFIIISIWMIVSLLTAIYSVFYSEKNNDNPIFIYPFEVRISKDYGKKDCYIMRDCYLFNMRIFGYWFPTAEEFSDTCKEIDHY
ncbi:hypothetical protein HMPREF3038_01611 [Akkermansia sp. KLE1797]|jgi:hypothetical protein|nr:hypothetical protein HMPREF3038_01611 [Akkermansia sp. KLE1797]KXU54101.1 hypothetical protein HMPREF3039_01766 [Akkermansia sp. KLE1798]KZA05587.1 hypothetical protein HMPREF1326_00762 [Akkermansia sp. KLE1605]